MSDFSQVLHKKDPGCLTSKTKLSKQMSPCPSWWWPKWKSFLRLSYFFYYFFFEIMQLSSDVFAQCLSVPISMLLKTAWEKQSDEILYVDKHMLLKGMLIRFKKAFWPEMSAVGVCQKLKPFFLLHNDSGSTFCVRQSTLSLVKVVAGIQDAYRSLKTP